MNCIVVHKMIHAYMVILSSDTKFNEVAILKE